jgi:hypothetical protein
MQECFWGKMNMTTHFIHSVCVDVFVCVMCTEYSWKIYKIRRGKRINYSLSGESFAKAQKFDSNNFKKETVPNSRADFADRV